FCSGFGFQGGGGPLPSVADQLIKPAYANALCEFINGHHSARTRSPHVGLTPIERISPWVLALHRCAWIERDGPTTGLAPFGIGRQTLANPACIGNRLVPTDTHYGQAFLAR